MEITRDIVLLVKKKVNKINTIYMTLIEIIETSNVLFVQLSRVEDDGNPDDALEPAEYAYSYQVLDHRKPDQLLKFKDFAPKVFRRIRQMFNVSERDII